MRVAGVSISVDASVAAGGLKAVWDTRGASPASKMSGCHSARSYVSSTGWEMEQHLLQEPGKVEVEAAKGVKMPRGKTYPLSPGLEGREAASWDLLVTPHVTSCPCGKGALCAGWSPVGSSVGCSLRQGGLIKKCLFSTLPKGAAY